MNEDLLRAELSNLNSTFNKHGFYFRTGEKGYSYSGVYSDSTQSNVQWAKVFISHDNIQIGRITYQFESHQMERYYIKQYKPQDYEYGIEDNIFYYLTYYFATGKILDIKKVIQTAHIIRILDLAKRITWRALHKKKGKRKKLTGRNYRHIAQALVNYFSGHLKEKPYAEHLNYLGVE